MTGLAKLTTTEAKLFFREPAGVFFILVFPVLLLCVLGAIPAFREPDPNMGGARTIELYVPIVISMTIALFSLSGLPGELAMYRERGILRRIATTPVRPSMMLAAQLIVFMIMAIGVTVVLLAIGRLVFDVDLPKQPLAYFLMYLLTVGTMLSLGLLIAAVVRSGKAAGAVGQVLFFPTLFFAGLWLPRAAMPEVLRNISDFTPLGAGVQSLTDAASGSWPQLLHVLVMVAWTAITATAAAKLFKWE
ncbi:ABC-2 type transport system permease protein [Herbihabitans rhizosphaerae]|uniref:Transport permease protein n=1 Tax=Herbihabitans rhizosphaerae TaxID=1872711 RepID=A0A4Q7KC43_9PSEU|nr:ABC transporter permease [Herbihabitans rhizosphaerae]RZS29842.1 ABC-2 type transport system permease protein [Herbihabitans rhizosphaerae]